MEVKKKAIHVAGCGGLWVYEMLKIRTHYEDNRLTDDGEVIILTRRPRSASHKHFFFLVLISVRG
jgi:hypothetical protein